jgi:hypothetical protein
MKKGITFIFVLLLCFSFYSKAQFNLGPKAGLVLNQFVLDNEDFSEDDLSFGLTAGLFFRFQSKNFYFQPEFLYSQKNGDFTYQSNFSNVDTVFTNKVAYFDIPVLFGVKLGKHLKINTGPVVSILLEDKITFENTNNSATVIIDDNAFETPTFGWQVGGSLDLGQLIIGTQYEFNVINSVEEISIPGINKTFTPDGRTKLWQIYVAIKLVPVVD